MPKTSPNDAPSDGDRRVLIQSERAIERSRELLKETGALLGVAVKGRQAPRQQP